jgi:hypothetical protein
MGMMTPRGGNRERAGRKSRPAPKALAIWCGQISPEQRDFIMRWLTPDERFGVLWAAANTASTGQVTPVPSSQVEQPTSLSPSK